MATEERRRRDVHATDAQDRMPTREEHEAEAAYQRGMHSVESMTEDLRSVTEMLPAIMRGGADIAREASEYIQEAARLSASALTKLLACRSPVDLIAVQAELARAQLRLIVNAAGELSRLGQVITTEAEARSAE